MAARLVRMPLLVLFLWGILPASAPAQSSGNAPAVLGETVVAREQGAAVASNVVTANGAASSANGIQYDGGPIIDDAPGVNVYFIWYGDWSGQATARHVLLNFIRHIGRSPWLAITTGYYSLRPGLFGEPGKDRVINAVHYRGATRDLYSVGSNLAGYQVYQAVAGAISSGALPADPNGVYFLLTSPDVNEAGFGTRHCGWHSSTAAAGYPAIAGVDIRYAFVGDAELQFPFSCIWDYQTPLSGSLGADGMANIIAHELTESVTDPDGTSWVNPGGQEIADLCAWTFGSAVHSGSASDPYPPNMLFDGIPYLIQQLWVNANGGYCALSWKR